MDGYAAAGWKILPALCVCVDSGSYAEIQQDIRCSNFEYDETKSKVGIFVLYTRNGTSICT